MINILKNIFYRRKVPEVSEERSERDRTVDFMSLFNCLSEGILLFDKNGSIILKNFSADKMLNMNTRGKVFEEIVSYLKLDISLEELIYIQNIGNKEFFVTRGDKYLKIQFLSFFGSEGRADRVIMAISDFSEQKLLDDRRKDFVANVSHELKTPLTSILSYSEALLDDMDDETRNKFVNVIITEANRMDRLIGDLLQLSKLSGDKFYINKRRYSFSLLIKNCIEKIKLDAENHKLTVDCYIVGELPEVMMDVDRMEQVILNILANAINYTPEKGKISVCAGKTFSQVYVKISDTGIGIPEEYVNRVFERFYRVDKARSRRQGGTGLGLAISKEIVEAHSGTITISSEFGKGTDVMIKLPIRLTENKEILYEDC